MPGAKAHSARLGALAASVGAKDPKWALLFDCDGVIVEVRPGRRRASIKPACCPMDASLHSLDMETSKKLTHKSLLLLLLLRLLLIHWAWMWGGGATV